MVKKLSDVLSSAAETLEHLGGKKNKLMVENVGLSKVLKRKTKHFEELDDETKDKIKKSPEMFKYVVNQIAIRNITNRIGIISEKRANILRNRMDELPIPEKDVEDLELNVKNRRETYRKEIKKDKKNIANEAEKVYGSFVEIENMRRTIQNQGQGNILG